MANDLALAASPDEIVTRPGWAVDDTLPGRIWDLRWSLFYAACGALAIAVYLAAGSHLAISVTAAAFVVGVVFGTAGMGANTFMTPVLILLFGFEPAAVVGTVAVYGAVTKSFGAWRHLRHGTPNLNLVFWLALGSVPMSIFGVGLVDRIKMNIGDDVNALLLNVIGITLMVAGVMYLVRAIAHLEHGDDDRLASLSTRRKIMSVGVGALAGFIVGLTSVGSGSIFGFLLLVLYPLATRRLIGTNVVHAAVLLVFTSLAQMAFGAVQFWTVLALIVGSVPGVVLGSRLSVSVSERGLRGVLSVVVFISGMLLLFKA
jgi:uncharacterized protein